MPNAQHLGVAMDSNTSLSPLLQPQSFPTSPSAGSRKRSIHEVDDAVFAGPDTKRPLVSYDGENQENCDPSQAMQVDNMTSSPSQPSKGQSSPAKGQSSPGSRVEVVVKARKDVGDFVTAPSSTPLAGEAATMSNPVDAKTDLGHAAASKKRKLSPASKEARQQEKEAKDRQKMDEKAKKEEEKKKREAEREEEKRVKEGEKKKREAEREEKKRVKEEEKAAKEEEKRIKEEEKEKKARSQMKLNSFFSKPSLPSASPRKVNASPSKGSASGEAVLSETSLDSQSDYAREFPDFFLKSHTTLAPSHRFERDTEALNHVRHAVDACLSSTKTQQGQPFRPSKIFQLIPFRRRQGRQTASVKQILLRMQNQNEGLVTINASQDAKTGANPQNLLRKVQLKSLKFTEDVRPPYRGTYTRPVSESSAMKLSRNPYHRGLPGTNYDYDSEIEWEEPEEGEDLDSEEEDEGSDGGDDDMDGFLDDEEDALAGGKRRLIVGDLEPVCSGVRWAVDCIDAELQVYQIETISEAVKFPIDPFSSAYWQNPRAIDQGPAMTRVAQTLHATWGGNPSSEAPATVGAALPTTTSKAKRPFPPEQLDEFKQAVEGSDLSKLGLVEILKKRFPKVSKDTLKTTLDQVAARVGQKEADKKWVCR